MADTVGTSVAVSTRNHDILGIYNRLNRFLVEMYKSVSSSVSLMNDFDQVRLASYITNIRGYIAWVIAQPQLDLPETSPREYPFEAAPVLGDVESEEINDVLNMIVLARDEITNSQSARMGSGLIKFDQARLSAVIDKVAAFLDNYIKTLTPLDLPESSPQAPVSGPGKVGI